MDRAEVAQSGPEAVMLGPDEAVLIDDVAADHAGGGGHSGLRLRQQTFHQLWVRISQVRRLLECKKKSQ
jgi:hypothetical protein